MKKNAIRESWAIKQIALRRETIAQLTHHQLARAGGGFIEATSAMISCRADMCTTSC